MPLPDPIIEVLSAFRPLFTAPTWRKLMTLLTGTLLAQGPRTVAAALRASGNEQASNWSCYHQVLNRARWSPLAVSRQLLVLIVETFVPAGTCVDLVIDETLSAEVGQQDEQTSPLPRQRPLEPREVGVQPWFALDRDGSRRQRALDARSAGPCPFCVC